LAFAARYEIAPDSGDDRRESRQKVRIDASADRGCALLIHDLSAGGFLAVVDGAAPAEERISVDLPGLGPVAARVAWRGESCFGGEFLAPLARSDLATVMGHASVIWADFAESRGQVGALAAAASAKAVQEEPDWDDTAPPPISEPAFAPDDRYPLAIRLRIIIGLAALSWLLLVAAVFALFG
jgi:hypothetical protein